MSRISHRDKEANRLCWSSLSFREDTGFSIYIVKQKNNLITTMHVNAVHPYPHLDVTFKPRCGI